MSERSEPEKPSGLPRRRMLAGLGMLGAAGVGVAGGFVGGRVGVESGAVQAPDATTGLITFRGRNQAGIVTEQQDRMMFATFNVTANSAAELREMLRDWTAAAEAMTKGQLIPGVQGNPQAPPPDTGEAVGLRTARLTITIGYGPSLFGDRFGLAPRKPARFAALPPLPGEDLDSARTGGDIAIQACADDPQVAFHAIRNLARIGTGTVVLNWTEIGFGRTSSTSSTQATPRNLLGFKDGTRNISAEQKELLDSHVWIGDESDQGWLRDGSYLVTRRIRMFVNQWDRDYLADQENVIGRYKTTGAPLTGSKEFDTPDFAGKNPAGEPIIPDNAHIRLAAHENNNGIRILRRGYSFTDGTDSTGNLMAGLFFIAYMKDPRQFIDLQRKLGANDALNEYIKHIGSGLFVCPPGLAPGQDWARQLYG